MRKGLAAGLHLLARRLVGCLLLLCAAGSALAQSTPEAEPIDPPGRVGSVSLLAGPVTLVDLASGSREEALLNWPVTGGWRIETGRTGRAEVRIGSTALRMDDETTVDFVRLDDHFMQMAVLRGSVSLRLRNRDLLDEIELLTQRERVVFDETGTYRIDVDRTPGITAVTAFAGRVRIAGGGSTFVVAAGQRGEVTSAPMVRFHVIAAVADRFDDWVAARDAREEAIRSASYVSRETTGMEILDEYGDWRTVEDYGPVWYPRDVVATWAPYRYGRWVWISPWGWTWVDEAPWGFAPLHYGRWVVIGGAWGWIPGVVVPRPVFAPALVAWYSVPGVTVSVGGPVGWFPLGPREPYVPAHRHSPRYLRVVNVQHVPNVESVTIVQTPKYVHRHPDRSTWVPEDRFGRPEPVHRGQRPPPSEWRQYIARPQPPANVPNTKRRQGTERAAPAASPAVPGVPAEAQPAVRPPAIVPRAGELPRSFDTPRAVQLPRAQPALPPSSRPAPSPGSVERPAGPRADEAPRSIDSPRTMDAPRSLPAPPALRPELPASRTAPTPGRAERPAGPRADEAPRSIESPRTIDAPRSLPVQPAPRPELPATPRDDRRMAPRAPMPPTVQQPSPTPTPAAPGAPFRATPTPQPPAGDVPAPRGRGDIGARPRDGDRRGPAAPVPSAEAGSAPSPAVPAPAREAGPVSRPERPPPPARDGGDQGGHRTGRPPAFPMVR